MYIYTYTQIDSHLPSTASVTESWSMPAGFAPTQLNTASSSSSLTASITNTLPPEVTW